MEVVSAKDKTGVESFQTGVGALLMFPVVYLSDEIGIESPSDRQRYVRAVERKTRAGV